LYVVLIGQAIIFFFNSRLIIRITNIKFINMKIKKGFTLIELLVVIAIIGLLSSVVLAALRSARDKGADASIQQSFASVRSAGQIYYDDRITDPGSAYGDTSYAPHNCTTVMTEVNVFSHPPIRAAIEAAQTTSGNTGVCYIAENPSSWVLVMPTKAVYGGNDAWCVDSAGNARFVVINDLVGALPADGPYATCNTSI